MRPNNCAITSPPGKISGLADGSRSTRLLEPATGKVVVKFPLASSAGCQLASLECTRWPRIRNRRFMLSHPMFTREVEQILADVRFDETPQTREQCVLIRFAPSDFSGSSYGLALAIADKLSRYAQNQPSATRRIYATGCVIADGHGEICGTQGFAAKVALIEQKAQPGSLFVFSRDDYDAADETLRKRLADLQDRGIECRSIAHIDELAEFWVQQKRNGWSMLRWVLVVVLVGVGAFVFQHIVGEHSVSVRAEFMTWSRDQKPVLLKHGDDLRTGELFKIAFIAQEDAFVYIFQQDLGRIQCLYPTAYLGGTPIGHQNPVRAGVVYYAPDEDLNFSLDGRIGLEKVYVLGFRARDDALETLCEALAYQSYKPTDGKRLERLQSDLQLRLERLGATPTLEFNHLPQ